MKAVVAILIGRSGGGTAALGAQIAGILNWPYASFGAYVRAEAAKRGLSGTRDELQNVGLELVSKDPEGFCRAVISMSRWRPGESLVVDGVRHKEIVAIMETMLAPAAVCMMALEADAPIREERLREKGETLTRGVARIDEHSVEAQLAGVLPSLGDIVLDARLPESENADRAIEFLMRQAEIPPSHSWITRDMLIRVPKAVRLRLNIRPGDRIEIVDWKAFLVGLKILDEDRIRSVTGRLREELKEIDPLAFVRELRGQGGSENETRD